MSAKLRQLLEEAEATIDRLYAFLDEPDLSDAEEAQAYRDLKDVVKRRAAVRMMMDKGA